MARPWAGGVAEGFAGTERDINKGQGVGIAQDLGGPVIVLATGVVRRNFILWMARSYFQ